MHIALKTEVGAYISDLCKHWLRKTNTNTSKITVKSAKTHTGQIPTILGSINIIITGIMYTEFYEIGTIKNGIMKRALKMWHMFADYNNMEKN